MATAFSLNPLLRSSIGFDRFNDLFESSFGRNDTASAYPPYNVERWGNDEYRIIFAVAGFSDDDLNVTVKDNVLMVEGRADRPAENDVTYLHRGIAKRAFRRNFRLADYVHVVNAALKDGLLHVTVKRELPEEAKPRVIPINESENVIEHDEEQAA